MKRNEVCAIITCGTDYKSSEFALKLAEQYDIMYAAVGIYPHEVINCDNFDRERLEKMLSHKKAVCVGEIGLDYYWDEPDRAIQKEWFARQIALAREVKLPIVIHSRDAAKDTMDIMTCEKAEEVGGIVHCFSYTKEIAKIFLDMGFSFGIGGVVTFKNSKKLKEAVEYIPIDKIVIETDCPYLSPEPHRGKRNSSLNLPYVIKAISELKNISEEEVMKITYENAMKIYKIAD